MSGLSNAEAALLGLLAEGPMYPYQIEREVKFRDMRFWTELSMSAIYKLLRKLEKKGMVLLKSEISAENRLRKLYSISDMGIEALKAKIKDILSAVEHTRWQVDIGTYNSHLLEKEEVRESLEKYRASLEDKVKGYRELIEFMRGLNCTVSHLAVARRPVFLLEAEMQWVDSFLAELGVKDID